MQIVPLDLVIQVPVSIFIVLGMFGNINVVVATLRNKKLRTKIGCLIFILTLGHILCLICETVGLFAGNRIREMPRRECFHRNVVYLFAMTFHSVMFLSISVDLSLSILFPFKHRYWKRTPYLLILCTPAVLSGAAVTAISFWLVNDTNMLRCAVAVSPPVSVYKWYSGYLVFCTSTAMLLTFSSLVLMFHKTGKQFASNSTSTRSSQNSDRRHVMRRISVSAFLMLSVYVCSWFLTGLIFLFFVIFLSKDQAEINTTFLVILVIPTYCQTFYVTYYRSRCYRRTYQEQLKAIYTWLVPCRNKKEVSQQQDNIRSDRFPVSSSFV